MLENIIRHIEHGMRPYEAALKGGGNRLHASFPHILADRRVHSGAADGRHRRPRVREFAVTVFGRDHRFRICVIDADADAVRTGAEGRMMQRGSRTSSLSRL